jgi:hypothetical protein
MSISLSLSTVVFFGFVVSVHVLRVCSIGVLSNCCSESVTTPLVKRVLPRELFDSIDGRPAWDCVKASP